MKPMVSTLHRSTTWLAIALVVLTIAAITPQPAVTAEDNPIVSSNLMPIYDQNFRAQSGRSIATGKVSRGRSAVRIGP
ncbi:MAG: hypothetical protein AAGF30_14390 [Pseudomonadota bacterium]